MFDIMLLTELTAKRIFGGRLPENATEAWKVYVKCQNILRYLAMLDATNMNRVATPQDIHWILADYLKEMAHRMHLQDEM